MEVARDFKRISRSYPYQLRGLLLFQYSTFVRVAETGEMKAHALVRNPIRAIPFDPDAFWVLDFTTGLLTEDRCVAVGPKCAARSGNVGAEASLCSVRECQC